MSKKINIISKVTESNRLETIRDLLEPIVYKQQGKIQNLYIKPFSSLGEYIIGVSGQNNHRQNDYTNWRFNTYIPDIEASYYEKWVKLNKDQYYLERAYLHLYIIDSKELALKEYVLVHCEPNFNKNEIEVSIQENYQKSPHIHLKTSKEPLPHSHFPLNLHDLENILTSVDDFTLAFKSAVRVLKEQVLDLHIS